MRAHRPLPGPSLCNHRRSRKPNSVLATLKFTATPYRRRWAKKKSKLTCNSWSKASKGRATITMPLKQRRGPGSKHRKFWPGWRFLRGSGLRRQSTKAPPKWDRSKYLAARCLYLRNCSDVSAAFLSPCDNFDSLSPLQASTRHPGNSWAHCILRRSKASSHPNVFQHGITKWRSLGAAGISGTCDKCDNLPWRWKRLPSLKGWCDTHLSKGRTGHGEARSSRTFS